MSDSENKSDKTESKLEPTLDTANTLVEELKAQAEKYKNDFLYLRAEFDNFRRNNAKERQDMLKYGSERLIVELLGVLDNFERALETPVTQENLPIYSKGIEMTAKELRSVLNKFGVTEVEAKGQTFDPNLHEALSSEATAESKPGTVHRVLRKPYRLHERLIRPAQVVVSKAIEK